MKGQKEKIELDSGNKKEDVSGKVDPSIKKALKERAKSEKRSDSRMLEIALYEYLSR